MIINLIQGASECVSNLVNENGIGEEVKHMFDRFMSDQWITVIENGSKDEYESELAIAINPIADKIVGITGEQFVDSMSFELRQWIKDTSLLWIKNKGGGQTTTEAEVNTMRQEDRHQRELKNLA